MKIQTFSIVAGSEACNARCPFCISKMTVPHGVDLQEPDVNWRNFAKACQLAKAAGVTTAMLTGKGEPTLFPHQITRYLSAMEDYAFPLVELQSNGIMFIEKRDKYSAHLNDWYRLGLTTIAISIVDIDPDKNRAIYSPHKDAYIDLAELIEMLHQHGLSVRLACVMAKGYVDNAERLNALLDFARRHGVEQLTVRPVRRPKNSRSQDTASWTEQHGLADQQIDEIASYLREQGTLLMRLMHGAEVFDVAGQNLCLTDCLTVGNDDNDIRQLIFFPDGHLRYDWQYPGAILL